MLSERGPHPALENAVYALALLLSLVVGYYGIKRLIELPVPELPKQERPSPAPARASALPPTEESVSELPPLEVSRAGRLRASGPPVPSPVEKK